MLTDYREIKVIKEFCERAQNILCNLTRILNQYLVFYKDRFKSQQKTLQTQSTTCTVSEPSWTWLYWEHDESTLWTFSTVQHVCYMTSSYIEPNYRVLWDSQLLESLIRKQLNTCHSTLITPAKSIHESLLRDPGLISFVLCPTLTVWL